MIPNRIEWVEQDDGRGMPENLHTYAYRKGSKWDFYQCYAFEHCSVGVPTTSELLGRLENELTLADSAVFV